VIRVLIAEDSSTARALLREILGSEPEIEVVGEARDGGEAVRLARELRPDVVTMDIRMPVLDGFQATREIMAEAPTRIIMVTGSPSAREVAFGLRAFDAGALTVQRRPPGPDDPDFERAARSLVDVVKAMAEVRIARRMRYRKRTAEARSGRIQVVAMAASTGGPPALKTILGNLPADFPVPILVVQHIARGFVQGLVEWLDHGCALRVRLAEEGRAAQPNSVFIAPEDVHLELERSGRMRLSNRPPVHGFRPSASVLFESVARSFGPRAAGVILSGMGEDGVDGLAHLHQAGGVVIAQSEETAAVFGMPGAAVAAGVVSTVLDLDEIAGALLREVDRA
jgi:two-component system chemotaxis response regulator CheB